MNRRNFLSGSACGTMGFLLGTDAKAEDDSLKLAQAALHREGWSESWQCAYNRALRTYNENKLLLKWNNGILNPGDWSPWSDKNLAILIENQDMVDSVYGIKSRHTEVVSFVNKLAAPFLCSTRAIFSPNELVYYERKRVKEDGSVVQCIESEDFISCEMVEEEDTWDNIKLETTNTQRIWGHNETETLETYPVKPVLLEDRMILHMDMAFLMNYISNAGTHMTTINPLVRLFFPQLFNSLSDQPVYESVMAKVKEMFNVINRKTLNEKPDNCLFAHSSIAEQISGRKNFKVSNNLDFYGEKDDVKIYGSLLINNNKLLLVDRAFESYFFCPYICFTPRNSASCRSFSYARKLMREGTKAIGLITMPLQVFAVK